MEGGGLRADDTAGGVAAAFDVGERHVLDREVALDGARDAGRLLEVSALIQDRGSGEWRVAHCRTHVWVLVRLCFPVISLKARESSEILHGRTRNVCQ
jgi:hypothetical protein